ncbi:DUF1657 domain-containing protein [Paenibacillus solisilvae]|uniref:DUF1657 domain-containing protein n=1 Tax=Paenibacillus solisilvae TaxID=2486751 RepID=A0ABW0W073_9BACL
MNSSSHAKRRRKIIPSSPVSQVKACLYSLRNAQTSLEQFAAITPNEEAKNMFTTAAQSAAEIVQQMEQRVHQLEHEDSSYPGY